VRLPPPDGVAARTPEGAALEDNRAVPTSVLIVDDHPSFRASARRMLEASGYAVVGEAADGAAAIAAAGELEPDLVLLDVQLPDINGFEVATEIAARGAVRPEIVLTSSRDLADFGDEVDASPVRGFIPKSELSGEALAALTGGR
jgi:DNA-binding NarL/FixJ family response regulator